MDFSSLRRTVTTVGFSAVTQLQHIRATTHDTRTNPAAAQCGHADDSPAQSLTRRATQAAAADPPVPGAAGGAPGCGEGKGMGPRDGATGAGVPQCMRTVVWNRAQHLTIDQP